MLWGDGMSTAPIDPVGACACPHPYHVPRRVDLGPIGHAFGATVATRQETETAVGVLLLCFACRSARHMREPDA